MLKITASLTKLTQQNSKIFPSHIYIFTVTCVETALIKDAETGLGTHVSLNIAKPITKNILPSRTSQTISNMWLLCVRMVS